MPSYCEVALPVPLDHTFTYGVCQGQSPQRGARVIVPFSTEKLIGVVTAIGTNAPPDIQVRYLEAVLDEEPLLSPHLLELAEWIAQYYLAPLGEVLRAMLPLAAEVRRTVYYRITDLGRDELAATIDGEPEKRNRGKGIAKSRARRPQKLSAEGQDIERRVLERLASGEPVKVSTLRTATAASLPLLSAMLRKKWIARETAASERDARRMERFAVLIPDTRLPSLTEKQQAILAELAACGGELPLAELRRRDLPASTLQTLVRRGLVRIEERPERFRLGGLPPTAAPFSLNAMQTDALATITSALGAFHPFLLHGITGSGKTAVYLAAMQKALDRGLSSILLVPEIGLTPQTAGLLDAAFGQKVALLHSALTPEERSEQWRRIRRGEAPIVVGTRSAIFAPAPNLGLILVDEEHDQSYKQEETPRYNARDVAVMRAKLAGAVVVMGSATPSLESWHNAERGKYARIELRDRVMNRPLPEVELIDMRREFQESDRDELFSRSLIAQTKAALERGEQALIL
ncbi:MAG TPA: primosomal protein N', partial [Terracidiphilus sp.]|nr:primosomal protein N' [Terracidiphilus sp.]